MSTDNQAIYWVREPHNTTLLCFIQDKILMKSFVHFQLFYHLLCPSPIVGIQTLDHRIMS